VFAISPIGPQKWAFWHGSKYVLSADRSLWGKSERFFFWHFRFLHQNVSKHYVGEKMGKKGHSAIESKAAVGQIGTARERRGAKNA